MLRTGSERAGLLGVYRTLEEVQMFATRKQFSYLMEEIKEVCEMEKVAKIRVA